MSNHRIIPMDVGCGILSQLPVKALLRFKSVSKEWCSLINDPYFIKLHLRQSMETNRNNLNIILKERISGKLLSVGFDSVNLDNPRELDHPLKRRPGAVPDDDYDYDYDYTQVVGSCNGLLCLTTYDQIYGTVVLWNISTGDYKVLPNELVKLPPTWGEVEQVTFYGFGYDSINDDYKLVRIVQDIDLSRSPPLLVEEVKVYSLKANTWRRGEEIPNHYFLQHFSRKVGTFVCGALHWLGIKERTWESPSSVIAFDVTTEKYHQIELLDNMERKTYNVDLGALQECLCAIATCLDNAVNVWIMKDYGVKESWTMLYCLQGCLSSGAYLYPLLLAYSKNEDGILLEKEGMSLLCYDINGKGFKDFNLPQLQNFKPLCPEICMESLVKLGD
ncbi:F-box protein CPR30-like [Durio zibethinus]|uniref:F-box protein CPR30-like n=1 Tax=Durio zibethinus TaxID=66656 RepID=A0A6P5ZFH5_DURZI|nr:F-box protein CPR30-like [Durio zibethinus]